MENNTENFSPVESLQIIQEMIHKAKNTVADKSFYFLLWGWLVFAASILQFILKVVVQTNAHPYAWMLMFIGTIVSIFHGMKEKERRKAKTYVDETLGFIWTGVGVSQVVVVAIFCLRGDWGNCYVFFMLLYSVGCFISGKVLNFSPLVWGAIAVWLLILAAPFLPYDYNILLLALAVLVSYIIPGLLLRQEYKRRITKPA
jgi:hypothetical protein